MALDCTAYARVWVNVIILQSTLWCYRITSRPSISLSLFLSHFPFLTVILSSTRGSTIRRNFTAAPRADKERLFCLFQMKKFKWEREKKTCFSFHYLSQNVLIKNLKSDFDWKYSIILKYYNKLIKLRMAEIFCYAIRKRRSATIN